MGPLRFWIAFIVAPFAIPAICFRLWELRPVYYELLLLYLFTIIAYAGTFLFGIPIYLFLHARKWTAFWFAPIAGFIVAGLTWCLIGIVMVLLWSESPLDEYLDWLRYVVWPYGPVGALVASSLWVMAWLEQAGSRRGPGP